MYPTASEWFYCMYIEIFGNPAWLQFQVGHIVGQVLAGFNARTVIESVTENANFAQVYKSTAF